MSPVETSPKEKRLDVAVANRLEPMLLPGLIGPEAAKSFFSVLSGDIINRRVLTQTHQQNVLRRDALEIHGRNYAPLLALHWGLTAFIAEKVGADLLPSFCFFRLYFADDICRVHADRPACEVSASLTLAYSDGLPWELSVASNLAEDRVSVVDDFGDESYRSFATMPGDGILYFGSSQRHGRVTPNPNRWSAHVFMQWVVRGGPHEAEAFERLDLPETPLF
jgi:hypothetical protein